MPGSKKSRVGHSPKRICCAAASATYSSLEKLTSVRYRKHAANAPTTQHATSVGMTAWYVERTGCAAATAISTQLFEHQDAPLIAPVHPLLEIGTGAAPLEHEHQTQ